MLAGLLRIQLENVTRLFFKKKKNKVAENYALFKWTRIKTNVKSLFLTAFVIMSSFITFTS